MGMDTARVAPQGPIVMTAIVPPTKGQPSSAVMRWIMIVMGWPTKGVDAWRASQCRATQVPKGPLV